MTVLPNSRHLTAWFFGAGFCFFSAACVVAVLGCARTGDELGSAVVASCWVAIITPGVALFANLRSRLVGLGLSWGVLAEAVICDWRFIIPAALPLATAGVYGLPQPADSMADVLLFLLDLVIVAAFMSMLSGGRALVEGALCERVAGLAQAGSLRARKVYVADQKRPGWSRLLVRKAVILTPGVLVRLTRREVDAIAARQMCHPAGGRLFLALFVFAVLYGAYGSQSLRALFGILAAETVFMGAFLARAGRVANRRATALTADAVSLASALQRGLTRDAEDHYSS